MASLLPVTGKILTHDLSILQAQQVSPSRSFTIQGCLSTGGKVGQGEGRGGGGQSSKECLTM